MSTSTPTAPAPSIARLAARWTRGTEPDRALVEETCAALRSARPADRPAVAAAVASLLPLVDDAGTRAPARRALFALLDAARRRAFTEAVPPADVDAWVALLAPAIERADYTLGEVLRSREETDPRVVAMRVLGPEGTELTVADLA